MGSEGRKSVFSLPRLRLWLPLVLILASLACALPFGGQPTPTRRAAFSTPTLPPEPTPTPAPLSPDLVESGPPQSVGLPLDGPITLCFNQPMDRLSVEAALTSQMEQPLTFTWVDDATVIVYPGDTLDPETQLILSLNDTARSAQGKPLLQPISLTYQTAGYLRLAHSLPVLGVVRPVNPVRLAKLHHLRNPLLEPPVLH